MDKREKGRPRVLKAATRRNIYIPDDLWAYAATIGDESSANGIRIALDYYKRRHTDYQQPNNAKGQQEADPN